MVRFALYYDKDKETEYLNEMSRKGYALTGFFMGFYYFDECRPSEYIYQIDITEGLFRVSNDYREFMREMGVEIVCRERGQRTVPLSCTRMWNPILSIIPELKRLLKPVRLSRVYACWWN